MKVPHKEQALIRSETGRKIAASIRDALIIDRRSNAEELIIHAHRIQTCNAEGNIWTAKDMHNSEGECFDGTGRFWNCGSKLCPSCVARQSKRNRNNLRNAIEQQKLRLGESLGMITLTFPTTDLPLLKARRIMLIAWQLLRKRKWFKDTIIGAARSEEFTLTRKGFHYHQHLLTRSKYVSYHMLRSEWTHCIKTAFDREDIPISIATADGLAVAHYRRVTSVNSAINEVAKYVTKNDSWSKLRPEDLLDVASIVRFPRMFELLGSFANRSLVAPAEEGDCGEDGDYLDTTSLTDGEQVTGWRQRLRSVGVAEYLQEFGDEVRDKSLFRVEQLKFRYPAASFARLKAPPLPSGDAVLRFLEAIDIDCPDCHRPHSWHDYSQRSNGFCGNMGNGLRSGSMVASGSQG